MRTNFQMIMEFRDYQSAERGIVSFEEIKIIKEHFCMFDMSPLELQNLRDMVVLMYGNWTRDARSKGDWYEFDSKSDTMSAITAVIDTVKVAKLCEI